MNNVEKFLDKIGKAIWAAISDVDKAAVLAEPFVDTAFPIAAAFYNGTVNAIASAKSTALATIDPAKTDLQNFAAVATAVTPILTGYAKTAGLSVPTQQVIMAYTADLLATIAKPATPATPAAAATA